MYKPPAVAPSAHRADGVRSEARRPRSRQGARRARLLPRRRVGARRIVQHRARPHALRADVPERRRDRRRTQFCRARRFAIFTTRQVQDRALGWQKPDGNNSAGHLMSPDAFGHTGFTGTSIWMDPRRDIFIILLSNRVNPDARQQEDRTRARAAGRRRDVARVLVNRVSSSDLETMNSHGDRLGHRRRVFPAVGRHRASRSRRRAARVSSEYFISGRAVPWWLAGASMVATTFAADTPLVVTGLVSTHGVAGNWLWWNMLMSGMLTVFFFARLWRRANVMTDVEFAEVRYSGKPAAALRVFRALYLAIPINLIILGWVTRAMIKILTISLGLRDVQIGGVTVSGRSHRRRHLLRHHDGVLGRRGHVGGAVDRSRAVRDQDDGRDRARGVRGESRRRHGRHEGEARDALRQRDGGAVGAAGLVHAQRARGVRVDAAAHAQRVPRRAVVGGVVSGRGAGRRRLRGAANLLGAHGARRRARDAVVPGRALRAASVAVDHHRSRDGDSLP